MLEQRRIRIADLEERSYAYTLAERRWPHHAGHLVIWYELDACHVGFVHRVPFHGERPGERPYRCVLDSGCDAVDAVSKRKAG